MTLKNKIAIFAILFLVLISTCLLFTKWAADQIHFASKTSKTASEIQTSFQELRICFEQTLMGPHDYLIHEGKDERDIFKNDFKQLIAKKNALKLLLSKNKTSNYDPDMAKKLERAQEKLLPIEKELSEFERIALVIFDIRHPIGNPKAGPLMEKMDLLITGLEDDLKKEGELFVHIHEKAFKNLIMINQRVPVLLLVLAIISLLCGIVLSLYLIKSITGPVNDLVLATRKVAQGDMTAKATEGTHDELGELAASFNHMVKEMATAREQVLNIFHGSGDAMRVIDRDFTILRENNEMENLTGIAVPTSVGRKCHELFFGGLCHTQACTLQRMIEGEERLEMETVKERKDGKKIFVELVATPLKAQGRVTGVIESFRDITERKQAEQALIEAKKETEKINAKLGKAIELAREMTEEAKDANTAKSEFLANMSHEIRTPLNGVIGMTGLLMDTELTNDQLHYVNTVQNSGESLLSVINDILDFSKIEAGKLEMEIINFDLRSMLDDFASMMSLRVQEKDLEFICAASPDVPALLQGDPGRLRQILVNLVGNAVKFTGKGEISVRAYLEKETDTHVTLLFSIKDTGIGIPAEKHDALFQSFTQADASTTREFGGTGLGLTISKTLCEMMGGKIGINSEVGKGSEFWFTACFEKQEEQLRPVIPTQMVDMKGLHVLIVDDNKTNREILHGQLGSWGCRVKWAVDGPDALHQFYQADNEKHPFQVAILDMQMPGMDGLSLGKSIKADDKLKSAHLIMMTSMGQVGDAKRFEKIGFAAYLIKPVGYSDLFDCLANIISSGSKPQVESSIITRHTVREQQRTNIRILLAEDNITNQQVATGILKKFGFVGVKTVENGVQAVKAVAESSYDLVLMDIQMPEMDGHEATRQIRKIESESDKSRIPIIAMTAHAMKEDRDKCIDAGMDDYVSKPIDAKFLLEALELWSPKDKSTAPSVLEPGPILKKGIKGKNDLKMFDKEALMKRLMDDTQLFETIILGFLDDIPRQIGALTKFIDHKNTVGAGKQGHQIKGAAGNVGADAFSQIAAEIETAGKAGDIDTLVSLLPQLEEAFDQLKKIVNNYLQKLKG